MFSYGKDFKITIFGASHDTVLGIIIEGLPAGITIDFDKIKVALSKRRPSSINETARVEADEFEMVSGLENGKTTEAPILIVLKNSNVRKSDYDQIKKIFRPGHADYSKFIKYNGKAFSTGGGIFSGRMTAPIVVAGEIARQIYDFKISSKIIFAKENTGSQIKIIASGVEPGLGEPFFDSVESCISHLLFSIPSVKGVCFGQILDIYKLGSDETIDEYYLDDGKVMTRKNYDGGVQGGITNGMPVIVNVFLKPIPTVKCEVKTLDNSMEYVLFKAEGRHDRQISERVRIVLESVVAIALLDLKMRSR